MTEPLSPSAQAVLDATTASAIQNLHGTYERDIAAALEAVANDWRVDTEFIGGVEYIRTTTLEMIAAELKAVPNSEVL